MTDALDVTTARARAESLMTSTCTIRERSGGWTTDPDTGAATQAAGPVVYSGKCRVRPAGRQSNPGELGGTEVFAFDYLISVPFAATEVQEKHRLTVDSSADPALVGIVVEIQKVDRGDHISARRLACTEVV